MKNTTRAAPNNAAGRGLHMSVRDEVSCEQPTEEKKIFGPASNNVLRLFAITWAACHYVKKLGESLRRRLPAVEVQQTVLFPGK